MGFPVRTGPQYLVYTSVTCSHDHEWSKNKNLRCHHFRIFLDQDPLWEGGWEREGGGVGGGGGREREGGGGDK
jgi:hypothetical protein